ncbi:MAG: single-stranded DNA-binding protein [Spirochaetia bacterium]|nr:single-stranded DNA-binding protein [Spirochaetia bacterium]
MAAASDVNVVVLVGRLTRDAELRYTNSGTAICSFSIAVNRRKRSGDSWENEANFFDIILWGRQGEALQKYLEKGKQVSVSGELRQNRWEQNGQKRSRVEIAANTIQLLGGNPGSGSGNYGNSSEDRFSSGKQHQAGGGRMNQPADTGNNSQLDDDFIGPEQFDDDIPF